MTWTDTIRTAAAATYQDLFDYWYHLPLLYLLEAAILYAAVSRTYTLPVLIGLPAAYLVLFVVIVGDPAFRRGPLSTAGITVKAAVYTTFLSFLLSIAQFVLGQEMPSSLQQPTGTVPSVLSVAITQLTHSPTYWVAITILTAFYLGLYRLAQHGNLRAALLESPRLLYRAPRLSGTAILGSFLITYGALVLAAAPFTVAGLPVMTLGGVAVPVAVFVLLIATTVGGMAGLRFTANILAAMPGQSAESSG